MRAWILVAARALVVGGVVLVSGAASRRAKTSATAANEDEASDRDDPVARAGGRAHPFGPRGRAERRRGPAPFAPSSAGASSAPPATGQPPPRYEADAAAAAAEERDQQVEAIRATGSEPGDLLATAQGIGKKWESLTAGGVAEVHVGQWECHKAGCFVHVLHRSDQTFEDLSSKILDSSELATWPGPKTRSTPIRKPD